MNLYREHLSNESRRGTVRLCADSDLNVMAAIMAEMIVIGAENCFMSNTITYQALSHHFKPVSAGVAPPAYEAVVSYHPEIKTPIVYFEKSVSAE